jgi:parallel beta-helix repeat protein
MRKLALATITLLFLAVAVKADTYLADCSELNTPGETYYLITDIEDYSSIPPYTCMNITADDIVLDCQGHKIDGVQEGNTVGILGYDVRRNITIKNCIISDWAVHLSFYDDSHIHITNTVVMNYGITQIGYYSTVTNSTFFNNTIGISIGDGNNISYNRIEQNEQYGIFISGSNNIIYNNLFNNTNNFYFSVTNINYWNTTRQAGTRIYSNGTEIGGNYWTNPTGNGYSDTCTDNNSDGFCDSPYVLTTDNIDYLALSNKYMSGCIELNTIGETYYLRQDILQINATTCINITADNVTLDCQGHTIDAYKPMSGPNPGIYGIYAYRTTNVTIKNCVLTNWRYGIYISSSNYSTLSNIKASYNDYGIYIISSNFNNLSNIIAEPGYMGGIYISSSNYNTLSNIIANGNAECGIYLISSNYNTLSNITASDYNDYGIYVYYSNYNTLSNITANSNIWDGIYVYYSNYNTLSNITTNSNYKYGIYLYSSSSNLTNIVSNSNSYGISLYFSSYSNLSNITANYNGDGIWLYDLGSATLSNINVSYNRDCGMYLQGLSSITFSNITANYNGGGFCFFDCFSGNFSNITTNYNNYGIYLQGLGSSILSNITTNYNNYGIYFYSSSSNILSNIIIDSNSYGVVLYSSNSNTIKNSIIQNNSQYGIVMNYAGNTPNLIYNNLFNNTNNFYFYGTVYPNYWNTTRQAGTRIYSNGTEIGGNYWTNPDGTGYSDTCTDNNRDGFCDSPYVLATDNIDYLALSNKYQGVCSCTDWMAGECVSSTQRKYTRICIPSGCDVETKYENDPTCAAPVEYPWLGLLTILLSPFWIVLLMAFGMSTNVESKLQTGGMAFLAALIIFLFVFAFYTKTIPLWIPIIFLIIAFGYIMIRGRI